MAQNELIEEIKAVRRGVEDRIQEAEAKLEAQNKMVQEAKQEHQELSKMVRERSGDIEQLKRRVHLLGNDIELHLERIDELITEVKQLSPYLVWCRREITKLEEGTADIEQARSRLESVKDHTGVGLKNR